MEALLEWKKYRAAQQNETGISLVNTNDFIFGTNEGNLRSYYGTRNMFERFLKQNGLQDKGIHFYELRHTFSNTLFEQNTNPRVVQSLMGHRKIETTMIYNTVRDNKYLESAVDIFDDRYGIAAEPVQESENKTRYYQPPHIKENVSNADTPSEIVGPISKEEITQKITAYMEKHNIDDVDEFFDLFKDTSKHSDSEM